MGFLRIVKLLKQSLKDTVSVDGMILDDKEGKINCQNMME